MRGPVTAIPAAALMLFAAACQQEPDAADRAAQAENDVAMVEQANEVLPPARQITPEPITYPDMEQHDLMGASCNYAPGTSFGVRVIARPEDAFMKIDGEMLRLAADPGARSLPLDTRSLYDGRQYSVRLTIAGDGEPTEQGQTDYEGTISLRDEHGRVVFDGSGLVQCGAASAG